jgi:hypothetical protein
MKPARLATLFAVAVAPLGAPACGDDDSGGAETTDTTAGRADLGAIKTYLSEHTQALAAETAALSEQGQAYYELAKTAGFDYAKLLESKRAKVAAVLQDAKAAYARANPAYEEMEGIVAGVSSLADYDVIIDAGSSGEDPENAVPFDLELPNGKTLKQPGNFMFSPRRPCTARTTNCWPRAPRPISTGTAMSRSARPCPTRGSSSQPRATSTSTPASSTPTPRASSPPSPTPSRRW